MHLEVAPTKPSQSPGVSALLALALLLLGSTANVAAQTVLESRQELAFDRPESWAMAYFSAATLFHDLGGVDDLTPGSVAWGVELANIPRIDEEDTRVGFNGSKFEDLNKSPVFGRARLWLGLPARFTAEFAYTPEVSIDGARPDGFYAAALGRPVYESDRWRMKARAFAQSGRVRGDFTCSAETASAGDDFERNPFGCQAPSQDEAEFDYTGLELSARWNRGRWRPFASWSVTRVRPEVQVNALTFDVIDRARLVTEGTIRSGVAGLSFDGAFDLHWTVALSYTPLDVVRDRGADRQSDDHWSLRVVLSQRLGKNSARR
ncbi:MAG: hypothetical protein AAGB27_07900 [Pseudomonadota bacterium]